MTEGIEKHFAIEITSIAGNRFVQEFRYEADCNKVLRSYEKHDAKAADGYRFDAVKLR